MLQSPESILRIAAVPLKKEVEGDVETKDAKTSSADVEILQIQRNLSHETQSTDYSSGIHSLDLLMEVYPALSESESESQVEDNDDDTAVHINSGQKQESAEDSLSLFNIVRMTSRWLEDKPFDEESLRALSERGDGHKNVYSKGVGGTEEYILPPANYNEKIVGITAYKGPYGKLVNEPAPTKAKSGSVITGARTSENENQEESVKRSYKRDGKAKKNGKTPKKKENMTCGVSSKFFWVIFTLGFILLAGAIVLGFLTSRLMNGSEVENNEAAASSGSTESSGNDNADQSPWADDGDLGDLITYLDPIPEELFPLGLCAGDCDRDADCAEGLVCYQRGANDKVPFCYGGENDDSRTDYCTYPTFSGEMPGSQSDECRTRVAVVQECYFETDNVIVVNFANCDPQDGDWIGVYPNATSFVNETSGIEMVGNDLINWAYTCGDIDCDGSPPSNSFGFPTEHNNGFDYSALQVYLLRNNVDSPEYEVVAKSEPFTPAQNCE